ncbi:MAG TPA: hypothetical protein VH307_23215 [Streptosporangiaceae bacterium]|nr:hypothetical protein [Streptosporangiaceae bacterium]
MVSQSRAAISSAIALLASYARISAVELTRICARGQRRPSSPHGT